MYRTEDKFLCSEQEFLILQSRISAILRCDANTNSNLGYKITSVYFDDMNDSNYMDSESGIQERKKYRIRIYNDSFDVIKLEVKYKFNNKVLKKTKIIDFKDMLLLLHGYCIKDEDMSIESPVTLFNLAIRENLLRPKVIVEYDRAAYVYASGNVRITFDRNVRCSTDFKRFVQGNTGQYQIVPELSRILEIKYDELIPGFILQVLENGNMQQISYSKYVICRDCKEDILCQQLM